MSNQEIREWVRLTDKMLDEVDPEVAPKTISTVRRLSDAFKFNLGRTNETNEEATKQS